MGEIRELDDRSLIGAFKRSGDGAYFAVLFDRYAKRLYSVAHRIHRDHARAEDCVQETFRRALEEIGRFDERSRESSFSAWVARIAEHVCLDEIRRTRTCQTFAREGGGDEPSPRTLSPEQQSMVSELREQLFKLAPESRICYLLHIDGYSYQEIAKLNGYTLGQVKTRIQTAKRHIKRFGKSKAYARGGSGQIAVLLRAGSGRLLHHSLLALPSQMPANKDGS